MITIIAGSRDITDESLVDEAVKASGFTVTSVIEGGQRTYVGKRIVGGVDWLARLWALKNGKPVKTINADWELYGRSAGPRRNSKMAEEGRQLIAIPRGESRGTRDMIKKAESRGLDIYIHRVS